MVSPESTRTVICQKWTESERGWGARPDGFTLHLTEEDRVQFVQKHWGDRQQESVPDDYSYPDGTPYVCEVSEEEYQEVVSHGGSRWFFNKDYPGSGGIDGWMTIKPQG